MIHKPSAATLDMIRRSGDINPAIAAQAQLEFAQALTLPLRQAILSGDINIFNVFPVDPNASLEYPLDLIAPGDENDLVAYTNPGNGRIAQRQVEGDYVKISTYGISNSIDWLLKVARNAEWDIVSRALQLLSFGFTKKINDDGWKTLISAATDRNIVVYDADAASGQFTKRLVSLAQIVMRRNGGGNSSSMNRRKMTDLYLSPEGVEDMRNWGLDQVDDTTRRDIYLASDGNPSKVFGVFLHALDEFGVSQEYQNFFINSLGGSLGSDLELAIAVDATKGTFLMPMKQEVSLFPDPALHRSQTEGYYGWAELGCAVLDNRDVLALTY